MDKDFKDYIEEHGITLFRIKALKDFGDIEKGELGGYIENYKNLSEEDNAMVYGNARVCGDARKQYTSNLIVTR